eukprot:1161543-Pelagomonas_calceolata.AAC.2
MREVCCSASGMLQLTAHISPSFMPVSPHEWRGVCEHNIYQVACGKALPPGPLQGHTHSME